MWTCPKCGRSFKRTNQGHYCGKAPENVDEYMHLQSPEAQKMIEKLRSIILRSAPEVKEQIAWSMPVYRLKNKSISFAACNKHISLYIESDVLEQFIDQLNEFTVKKNAIYLPYDKELPVNTIEQIVNQSFETP